MDRPFVFLFLEDGRPIGRREVLWTVLGSRMAQAMSWEEKKDGRTVQVYGPGLKTTSLAGLQNWLEARAVLHGS